MFGLTRKALPDQNEIVVNGPAIIRVTKTKSGSVKMLVEAPRSTDVWRGEMAPAEIIADQIRTAMREEMEAA